ncbi:MAG: aminoacyl-tRNA hydrolase [Myxococcota bacterium]
MRLIVGLGNPGTRYRDTPHNAGFLVCDRFAERHHIRNETKKFQGRFRRGRVGREEVALLKPETYMNLSGLSVAEAVRYLPLGAEDLLLVFDDMDLPRGRIRVRPGGGSGGHHGLQSVIDQLGMRDFPRVRVGVGRPRDARDPTAHLLSRIREEERRIFLETVDLAVCAIETILEEGVEEAMNRYNGISLVDAQEEEGKA